MPTVNTYGIASGPAQEAYVPPQLRAGDGEFLTRSMTVKMGVVLAQYEVIAREFASGKIVKWDPAAADEGTTEALAVSCYAVDATAADVNAAVYVTGFFNTDALVWGTATDAQKETAFDRTAITHRKLWFSKP